MALMVNGKKVLGYAIGGNEFYSLDNLKVSSLKCDFNTFPYNVSVSLDQPLSPGSAFTVKDSFTVKDLINKGEKIRLIVTFHDNVEDTAYSLDSGTIDLSKPDSNGHFNFIFQLVNNAPEIFYNTEGYFSPSSLNAYCSSDPSDSTFHIYSDAFAMYTNAYSSDKYDSGYMQVLYLD